MEVLNEDQLFDEVGILINFLSIEKINKWNSEDKNSEDRWVKMFKCLDADSAKLINLKKLCEFVFCLPGIVLALLLIDYFLLLIITGVPKNLK